MDEIEKAVKSYEVKKVDVSRQLKALEAFEAQAVKSAEETKVKVDEEVGGLQQCLKDIESVRAWEEISVVSICWLDCPSSLPSVQRAAYGSSISIDPADVLSTSRTTSSKPFPRRKNTWRKRFGGGSGVHRLGTG